MDIQEVLSTVLIGLGIFLTARLALIYFVAKKISQRILAAQYMHVLNAPQYQVKGKYE